MGILTRENPDAAKAAKLASLKADRANILAYGERDRHPDDAKKLEELEKQIAELEGE